MFRMMLTLFAVMLSWMFSPDDGGGGSGDSGGDNSGNDGNSGGSGQQSGSDGGSGGNGRSFSQEDVDRIAGRRATESAASAQQRIADDLGVSLDEAKTIIAGHQEQQRANQTELEQVKTDKQKAETDRDSYKGQYETLLKSSSLASAFQAAGAKPGYVELLVGASSTSDLKITKDGKVEGLDAIVTARKESHPDLFEAQTQQDGGDNGGNRQGQQHRSADANGQQTGGGRPQNLKQALQQYYGN